MCGVSELDQKILSFSEQSISHEKGDFATETENFFTKNGAEEMAIGERIRTAREAANLTQEELGRACGTTKQTIYKYENGIVSNIPLDRLELIAKAVGVNSAYIAGW